MARVVAFLLLVLSGAAYAGPLEQPTLLVASPDMQGPYAQTVLIAVPVGDEHLGFIVNRATEMKLATLFPEHAASQKVVDPVYFGGPQMAEAVFAVVRRNPGAEALRLVGEVFLVADTDAGYWHVTEADPAVFWQDNHALWQQLAERLGNGHAPQRGRGFQSAGL